MIIRKHTIIKVQTNRNQSQTESIVQDKTITINVNNRPHTLTAIHGNEKALIIGFLAYHQLIRTPNDIIEMTGENVHYTITTRPIEPVAPAPLTPVCISPTVIYRLTAYFQEKSLLYRQLGLCESAALASTEDLHVHAEDLTTETSLYKAIGLNLLSPAQCPILLTSSAIHADWLKHMSVMNINIVVSRTTATYQAIEYANQKGITLIGFARGMKCSILTHPKQVDIRKV